MYLGSELSDGFEPHDHIYSAVHATARAGSHAGSSRGVPGVVEQVGAGRVLYRVLPTDPADGQIEANLRNIKVRLVHTAV